MTRRIPNESDVLNKYSKTILMLILARVNGYYNPYIQHAIMEEEAKIMHGEVISPAEKEFFKHRLQTLYPKIGYSDVKTAITLLAEQKAANCLVWCILIKGTMDGLSLRDNLTEYPMIMKMKKM